MVCIHQLLLEHRSRSGRVGRRAGRIEYITITSADRQVWLIHAHFDLSSLAGLRRSLWVVAQSVLPAQFLGDLREGRRKILRGITLIISRAGSFGQFVQVSIRHFVIASTISNSTSSAEYSAENLTENIGIGVWPTAGARPATTTTTTATTLVHVSVVLHRVD